MSQASTFTGEQVAIAARELRQAAGADELRQTTGADQQRYDIPQALSMLREEIRLLRERGFSNEKIADLLTGFDICVSANDVGHNGPQPRFAE